MNGAADAYRGGLLSDFGLGPADERDWQRAARAGQEFEDRLTDRLARRPEGSRARAVYGAEDVHQFARRAILESLALAPGERLLEIGCGGGLCTSSAELRGTPAAPQPLAARGHFHSDRELLELARRAGLELAAVIRDGGGQLLHAKVPA